MNLQAIQAALREQNIDAWLFYDHHRRDPIAYRVLGLSDSLFVTRRWYYLLPAQGEPAKLVHKIEAGHLDTLPGTKTEYAGWQELGGKLQSMLAPYKRIAMEYSPDNRVFVILVGGRRHHRSSAQLRQRSGQFRRPGQQVRSDVDRRSDQESL